MIRVFLGHDRKEDVAFHVASHSIHRHSSRPVAIAPLMLSQLAGVFDRPRDPRQSTDFAFTRFLVPYLCNYEGWAIFADCDILVRADLAELWDLRDDRYAVMVVRHEYIPSQSSKFLGMPQSTYPRKNWSSVMLFNNARCGALTPEYVSTAPGLHLHQFAWLDDELIGELPHVWNHLVDHDPMLPAAWIANLHYTSGGPWFPDCEGCGYADLWHTELQRAMSPVSTPSIRQHCA